MVKFYIAQLIFKVYLWPALHLIAFCQLAFEMQCKLSEHLQLTFRKTSISTNSVDYCVNCSTMIYTGWAPQAATAISICILQTPKHSLQNPDECCLCVFLLADTAFLSCNSPPAENLPNFSSVSTRVGC